MRLRVGEGLPVRFRALLRQSGRPLQTVVEVRLLVSPVSTCRGLILLAERREPDLVSRLPLVLLLGRPETTGGPLREFQVTGTSV